MDDRTNSVAAKMARLVAAVEQAREKPSRQARQSPGKELEAAIRLGESFPPRSREDLSYPVLKRLLKSASPAARGTGGLPTAQ